MGVNTTVVFTDLTGSTTVFEAFGNSRATRAVIQLISWICDLMQAHGGQVIKTMGDGVLTVFPDASQAVHAMVDLQRQHHTNLQQQPLAEYLPIRVGIVSGEVEIVNQDCYGDAVNVASRLCDLAGPHEIWVASVELDYSSREQGIRFYSLGPINVRGRIEPCNVYKVEWHEEQSTDFVTMQDNLEVHDEAAQGNVPVEQEIQLVWSDQTKLFRALDLPIHIGRIRHCEFVVADPRVSRTHARLEWRNGRVLLADISSYGTWIRFAGARSELLLRREQCVLHGRGEIALGASFTNSSTPVVKFELR